MKLLNCFSGGLEKLNEEVQRLGVSLNSGGGEVKVRIISGAVCNLLSES